MVNGGLWCSGPNAWFASGGSPLAVAESSGIVNELRLEVLVSVDRGIGVVSGCVMVDQSGAACGYVRCVILSAASVRGDA